MTVVSSVHHEELSSIGARVWRIKMSFLLKICMYLYVFVWVHCIVNSMCINIHRPGRYRWRGFEMLPPQVIWSAWLVFTRCTISFSPSSFLQKLSTWISVTSPLDFSIFLCALPFLLPLLYFFVYSPPPH